MKDMVKGRVENDDKTIKKPSLRAEKPASRQPGGSERETSGLTDLQRKIGNRAVQRLLAQRSGDGAFDLDDETDALINRERGGGQSLDSTVQGKMGAAMDSDFSGVRVHTSAESDDLTRRLGAKAFTTGKDVYFREGAYVPHSANGQELIAHELTHVVQQSSGEPATGGEMTVNAPDDVYEQEADVVAKEVAGMDPNPSLQRQIEEEEEELQMQVEEEEEEEILQTQEEEEEEMMM